MTLTLVSRASGTVSIAKVIALQSVTTFGSYTDSSATPALGWCRDCGTESRTGSRAGGRKVEDAVIVVRIRSERIRGAARVRCFRGETREARLRWTCGEQRTLNILYLEKDAEGVSAK